MQINLSEKAIQHIQEKGGRAAVDLVCISSWAGSTAEVSVDTNVSRRRNTSSYQVVRQEGIELLVSPDLAKHSRQLSVELKQFWFFRHLKAEAELTNGQVLGRRGG